MELYNLGKVPWEETQLLYHSLAQLGREALCLVSPATPYVCIGYHQDVEQEVDLKFCRENAIPIFRREVGGGSVYLDGDQLFFQLVLNRNNPILPVRIDAFYKKFLKPIIDLHHRMDVVAEYKPVNDLVVNKRKISGTGAGEIDDSIVFVGNLILDFDYVTMSRILKIPDEKFRDKVKDNIEENLTTIRREIDEEAADQWNETRLNNMMVEEFEKLLGPLTVVEKDEALISHMKGLKKRMMHDDWLYRKGKQVEGRIVKVRSGLQVVQRMHKATGGLIRAEFCFRDGRYADVSITGDYFCFPKEIDNRLALTIEGSSKVEINQVITGFYDKYNFEWPGVTVADWIKIFRV